MGFQMKGNRVRNLIIVLLIVSNIVALTMLNKTSHRLVFADQLVYGEFLSCLLMTNSYLLEKVVSNDRVGYLMIPFYNIEYEQVHDMLRSFQLEYEFGAINGSLNLYFIELSHYIERGNKLTEEDYSFLEYMYGRRKLLKENIDEIHQRISLSNQVSKDQINEMVVVYAAECKLIEEVSGTYLSSAIKRFKSVY